MARAYSVGVSAATKPRSGGEFNRHAPYFTQCSRIAIAIAGNRIWPHFRFERAAATPPRFAGRLPVLTARGHAEHRLRPLCKLIRAIDRAQSVPPQLKCDSYRLHSLEHGGVYDPREAPASSRLTRRPPTILRRHLAAKVPVSDLCDEYRIQLSLFYVWQRDLERLISLTRSLAARPEWTTLMGCEERHFELSVSEVSAGSGVRTVTEGVIDAAAFDGVQWHVFDWKTDQSTDDEWAERAPVYQAQVDAYARILSTRYGHSAVGIVVRLD